MSLDSLYAIWLPTKALFLIRLISVYVKNSKWIYIVYVSISEEEIFITPQEIALKYTFLIIFREEFVNTFHVLDTKTMIFTPENNYRSLVS